MNYKKIYKKISSHKIILYVSPIVIYLIVAYLLWGPPNFYDIHRLFFTPSGDPQLFTWSLNWWPFSISHGLNPFIEKFIFYPSGFNLSWATSIPTLALIMSPFTYIWGAMTSFNIIALVALPASALSCYYLIYYICKKYWASVLCGFIYGFSSFQLGQLLGHPCFYVAFVAPLVVLVVMLRFNDRLGKIPFILILGLLLAMEFGLSSEFFASMYLFGALTWICILVLIDKKYRPKVYKITGEIILSGVVTLVLISPFIYYLLKGYKDVPAVINPAQGYSADLLNFVIPTKLTLIGGSTFAKTSTAFTGNTSEQGAYLTIPLLAFMVTFSLYYWQKWYVKVLALVATVIGILSLGPWLQIAGKVKPYMLPEAIFTHLPVVRSMLPVRFSMYMFLVAAIMLGVWFTDKPKKTKNRKPVLVTLMKYLLVMVILILLIPNRSDYSWQNPNIPKIFSPNIVGKYIKPNSNVMFLPFQIGYDPEFWQVYSKMKFTTSNGYLGFIPPSISNYPTASDLYHDAAIPNFQKNFEVFCKTHKITEILYAYYAPVISPIDVHEVNRLNWPTKTVDGVVIISVPQAYQ